jgi:fructokinase
MKKQVCIVGIGEALVDIFESGEATVGGAPFNVAFHAHQLLTANGSGTGCIVSAIGNDPWGRLILSKCQAASMDTDFIYVNSTNPTGTAYVYEGNADAGFQINPNVAWDYLNPDPKLLQLAARCSAVAFGSLAQRSFQSRTTIQDFVRRVQGIRLYDVNLRRNTTDGVAGYTREIILESCDLATHVKANDSECEEIAQLLEFDLQSRDANDRLLEFSHRLQKEFQITGIIVTRGAQGAFYISADQQFQLADSTLDQGTIHPVGAGDAFSAAVLFGLTSGWSTTATLNLAEHLAEWVVQHETATPLLSAELRALLTSTPED